MQDFKTSYAIYKLRFFCEPKDRPDIRRAALKTVQEGLAEAGVSIPHHKLEIPEK